jgi:eukaryotic-like serine/threonine-protein kinase
MIADSNLGRTLKDRYQLVQLLGQGSMGRVYEARDLTLGAIPVAVKCLSQALLSDRMRTRFEREAKTCAQLGQRSLHIVRVMDYGVDGDGIPFYVMEYLKGEDLNHLISRQLLSLPRFLHLAHQICLGLQCAHEGIHIDGVRHPIVHRDIKPSNIWVEQNPSLGELVKILDFGIAKVLQAEVSQTNCFMGTLAYASPEQMEGHQLDARSDIYSLGIMLFQMLTGRMPLQADAQSFGSWYKAHLFQPPRSLSTINSSLKIPLPLQDLVMSCLAKSPSDRPQSVADILATLQSIQDQQEADNRPNQPPAAARSPLSPPTPSVHAKAPLLPAEQACRAAIWPAHMPVAEIVFPNPIQCHEGTIPTLWVMQSMQEIQKRKQCTRYNQFLFLEAPHPMALWLTVLYNQDHGPRWLPCYLDFKTAHGRQMAKLLGQDNHYRILFFAHEEPGSCQLIQTSTITAAQGKLLQNWATIGQLSSSSPNPGLSKERLKSALEELKPQILTKLGALYQRLS